MTNTIIRKFKAGGPGTKRLVKKYGKKLMNVRYIYDSKNHKRIKTVELIENEDNWQPDDGKIAWNKVVHLHVEYGESEIGRLIKSAGGSWNRENKYWELQYREVVSLGLANRIIND